MLTLERCRYTDIIFLKFCFLYSNNDYSGCVDLLKNEESVFLEIYPSFFVNILKIKLRLDVGEINFLTADDTNALINAWVQNEHVDLYSEIMCFVLSEYLYKTFNVYEKNETHYAIMSFVDSPHWNALTKEYIRAWDSENDSDRKSVMLDIVFDKASDALVSRLKWLKRSIL